ncbi:hypothetical protein SESBI_19575 [Sesbania bispinosa]|nr:hypothetical protein SESBI_19575 [Sesbania bispinosa]
MHKIKTRRTFQPRGTNQDPIPEAAIIDQPRALDFMNFTNSQLITQQHEDTSPLKNADNY